MSSFLLQILVVFNGRSIFFAYSKINLIKEENIHFSITPTKPFIFLYLLTNFISFIYTRFIYIYPILYYAIQFFLFLISTKTSFFIYSSRSIEHRSLNEKDILFFFNFLSQYKRIKWQSKQYLLFYMDAFIFKSLSQRTNNFSFTYTKFEMKNISHSFDFFQLINFMNNNHQIPNS